MRVLIVEDEAQQRALLRRVVEEAATEVVEAGTAEEAVAAPGEFDVIISDYSLPNQKTARDIARARKEKLIVLSGYDPPDDWPGVVWYRKPITLDELRGIIREIKENRI